MFIIFLLIQFGISYILNLLGVSNDVNAYIFILINMIYMILMFEIKYKEISVILIIGYILRFIFLLWDLYGKDMFIFPGSGMDSEGFYRSAILISSNLSLLKENIYGGMYSKILGFIFYFIGDNRVLGQYINVILGVFIIIILYKCLRILNLNDKSIKKSIFIISIFPNALIYSSILLRENAITFFAILSAYYFIKWYKEGKLINQLLSIIFILFASSFHSGVIGILIGYIIAYIVYNRKEDVIRVSFKSLIIGVIFISFVTILVSENSVFLAKFKNINKIEDIIDVANSRRGGSTYLNSLKLDNPIQILIYSPIYMFYFLASPLPWNWRGLRDIITFFIDSLLYLVIVYNFIKKNKSKSNINDKDNLFTFLSISVILSIFIFGIGVKNAGTAMRHRHKILPILLLLNAISKEASYDREFKKIYD